LKAQISCLPPTSVTPRRDVTNAYYKPQSPSV
jgi:hypothetical protein